MFFDCRTEFWWVSPYVSKGLWRGQLLFAQTHMEICIRKMLLQMMNGTPERCMGLITAPANAVTP